ncbi:MAG TPA: NADH-quinone oxidoreductase subunit C [Candidatus Limnocylindrales bacterium]|nr:NADH-quinone oxidoreductase subunit C [Candidatus Limnocylindrales bacterium]
MALDVQDLAAKVAAAVPASDARAVEGSLMPMILVGSTEMPEVLRYLRDAPGLEFKLFVDATAIDREAPQGLLEVVYIVRSISDWSAMVVVKTVVDAAEAVMPTSSHVYAGVNWAEREIWDMFGVVFEGHPDPRRILMYPEFEGHPLRKSYPYQKRQPLTPERDPLANPWPRKQ